MTLPITQKGFTPILIIVILFAVTATVGGSYLLFTNLNKPAVIKEKSTVIQPLFQDLKRSVEDIADHLNDTPSGSDADSSERYSQKGSSLVKTATDNLDKIKIQIDKLNVSETQGYKKTLTDYIAKSEELINYEKDDIRISKDYDSTRRDYEQLTKDIAGVSNYIYSDPARYVKEVGVAIEKQDKIIKALSDLNEDGLYKKYHETYIQTLKDERDFLQNVKDAVSNRDDDAFADATKKYTQVFTDRSKELARVIDEFKEKYKSTISELKSLADKVDQSYNDLKNQFKF